MRAPGFRGRGVAPVPTTAGVHRFTWDMRHFGAKNAQGDPSGRGPLAPPGRYTVELTVDGETVSSDFRLNMDPRVVAEGWVTAEQVREQVALALKARDMLGEARMAAARLEAGMESGSNEALTAIHDELVTDPMRYSQPMLVDQISYLAGNLDSADQPPGQDAIERYAELRAQLDDVLSRLDAAGVGGE